MKLTKKTWVLVAIPSILFIGFKYTQKRDLDAFYLKRLTSYSHQTHLSKDQSEHMDNYLVGEIRHIEACMQRDGYSGTQISDMKLDSYFLAAKERSDWEKQRKESGVKG